MFTGWWGVELKQKEYIEPELEELFDRAIKVRSLYPNENEYRKELISLLETVHAFAKEINLKNEFIKNNELRDACMGIWVFGIENIAREKKYYLLNPEFSEGKIYNSGSKLYKIYLKSVGIDATHRMKEEDKLKYVKGLFNLLYIKNNLLSEGKTLEELVINLNLQYIVINREILIQLMQRLISRESKQKNRILRALPAESVIDLDMTKLHIDYVEKEGDNSDRLLMAKLAAAICKLNKRENKTSSSMPHSLRYKLGILLYIMESIKRENKYYYLWSPEGNCTLFDLCSNVLKGSYYFINDATKIECLTAIKCLLNDPNERVHIEDYINKKMPGEKHDYLGPLFQTISSNIDTIIKSFSSDVSLTTKVLAGCGAITGASFGAGLGFFLGSETATTDPIVQYKGALSPLAGIAMKLTLGEAGSYLGYYAADKVVNATLERVFSKVFEAFGALVIGTGCGVMSLIIYDFTFATARHLCQLYCQLSDEVGDTYLNKEDLEYIKILLDLPGEVFSAVDKNKIKELTGQKLQLSFIYDDKSRESSQSAVEDEESFEDFYVMKGRIC